MTRLTPMTLAAAAICILAPTASLANSAWTDLTRAFERACMSDAGKSAEFTTSRVDAGLKAAKGRTSVRAWYKPGDSCRIEFHYPQQVTRSEAVAASVQKIAVGLAGKLGGTVEHRRKGKRNEYFKVSTPVGEYSIGAQYERDGRVTGLSINKR